MDLPSFVVELQKSTVALVSALVWPTTVLLTLWLFRKELRALIGGIRSFNLRTGEVQLADKMLVLSGLIRSMEGMSDLEHPTGTVSAINKNGNVKPSEAPNRIVDQSAIKKSDEFTLARASLAQKMAKMSEAGLAILVGQRVVQAWGSLEDALMFTAKKMGLWPTEKSLSGLAHPEEFQVLLHEMELKGILTSTHIRAIIQLSEIGRDMVFSKAINRVTPEEILEYQSMAQDVLHAVKEQLG